MSELRVMDGTGDTKVIWDASKPAEVEAAKATFDSLTAKRYAAFSVKKGGDKGDRITTFDPQAEKIILVPPMAGG